MKDPTRPMSQLGAKPLRALGEAIHRWPFEPSGTGGYKKAEVTVGGVDTDALHSKSMETKEIPRPLLYWRSCGCNGMAWGLQLSVGLVVCRGCRWCDCRFLVFFVSRSELQPKTARDRATDQ